MKDFRLEAPFESPRRPVQGTPYHYQLAVSKTSRSLDVMPVRVAQPELDESGSRRSGVVLLLGDQVVASYVYPGHQFYDNVRVSVHPEHRRQGLAMHLIRIWFEHTKREQVITPQIMNAASARAFLRAQVGICQWAVEQGKSVPDAVRSELGTEVQKKELLDRLVEVERTGNSWTFQA